MVNTNNEAFFDHFKHTGLTYDDVTLVTQYADFLPADTDLTANLTRRVSLNVPFVSAAMDTVTESSMAIAMALNGGIGIIHKNMDPVTQRTHVKRVKFYLNGFLKKARTMGPTDTVEDLYRARDEKGWSFHSFPILDADRKLLGMVTRRELKYCDNPATPLREIMIPDLMTAPVGTTIDQAYAFMKKHKISILPVVDENGILDGMYCYSDVEDILKGHHPLYNRDDQHQLRCGAAVSPNGYDRVGCLMEARLDVVVIDTAHGHTKGVIEMVRWIKKNYPAVDVVAGNVAAAEGAKALVEAGADGIKVGVGPGSICTTRVVAGVGIPQITAIYECARVAAQAGVPVIADGGIRHSGDVAKAIAAGAGSVMMGRTLAATDEGPGERVLFQGRQYVTYRGMGSLSAMTQRFGSADRYGQAGVAAEKMVPEGVEGMVPYAGSVNEVLDQYIGGLRQSLGYNGCRTIPELQERARFKRITAAGVRESHPHDVTLTKDAPNYKASDMR
jgi:IMP dehydrogenase